jgi:hypothetical protein
VGDPARTIAVMPQPELTVTTIRYLYATTWLPTSDREDLVAVPGGATRALDTAANLLHTAIWNLRRQGVLELEQLRPVEEEPVLFLGGRSFCRFDFSDPGYDSPGLEGALVKAARTVGPSERFLDKAVDRLSHEDDYGIRRLVLALELKDRFPWDTVVGHCLAEAAAAGLVRQKGWLLKVVEILDLPAIQSLREQSDELRAARRADMEREPELHNAVIADCLQAIHWAYGDAGD